MAGLFNALTSSASGVLDLAAEEVQGLEKGVADVVAPLVNGAAPLRRKKRGAPPVGLFQGHDKVSGFGVSTAVTGTSETFGGASKVKYRVCFSMEELSDSLEVDQSLSVSYLSVASMNEKLKFIENQKVSTYSTSIVVYAKHTMGIETMTDVALKPGIEAPKSKDEVKEFVKSYGDSFLSSRTKGGEYFAVYTFYSESRQKQTELTAEMQAEGVFASVSVDASLQVKLNKFRSSQKTRTSFDQSISGISDPEFPSADDVIPFALKFPSLPLTAPVIISFETSGYERVPGIGTRFDAVARNRDLISGTGSGGQTNFIAELSRLKQLQNDVSFLKEIYSFYGGFDGDTKLKSVEVEVQEDEGKVRTLLQGYVDDPTQPITAPVLTSLSRGTPSLNYVIERSPKFGGNGNTKFDDVNIESYFAQRTRIRAISIRSSARLVGALRITYASDKGSWKEIRGSEEHGGSHETPELLLSSNQLVIGVKGSYGDIPDLSPTSSLTKLIVSTSDGRSVGSDSQEFGSKFEWSVPKEEEGCFVMGFAGQHGWYLDELQVIYGSFRPAVWDTYVSH